MGNKELYIIDGAVSGQQDSRHFLLCIARWMMDVHGVSFKKYILKCHQ